MNDVAALLVASVALSVALRYWSLAQRPVLRFVHTAFNASLLRRVPLLSRRRFVPTVWLADGHLQTVFASLSWLPSLFFTIPDVPYERRMLPVKAFCAERFPGQVALDWCEPQDRPAAETTPTVIVLHGLTGGSHERYVRFLADTILHRLGWRVVVFNARGCGGTDIVSPQVYCGAYTDDLRQVVAHVHEKLPKSPLLAVGYSLGSNIMTKYLGEEGEATPIMAAMSIGNPYDLLRSNIELESTWFRRAIYSRVLASNLVGLVSRFEHMFQDVDFVKWSDMQRVKTLRQFDERLTSKSFGYETVEDYYRDASCARVIHNVKVPLLCLNALDDPVCDPAAIPRKAFDENPFLMLATTRCGGHSMDWYRGMLFPRTWSNHVAAEFFTAIMTSDWRQEFVERRAKFLDERAHRHEPMISCLSKIPSCSCLDSDKSANAQLEGESHEHRLSSSPAAEHKHGGEGEVVHEHALVQSSADQTQTAAVSTVAARIERLERSIRNAERLVRLAAKRRKRKRQRTK